jgi:thymidylate kinase
VPAVALIGLDGTGKTAVATRVAATIPNAKYVYMGANWDSSSHLLPTTRLVGWLMSTLRSGRTGDTPNAISNRSTEKDRGWRTTSLYRTARSGLSLANLVAEEWYRQMIAWTYLRRGATVIYDRHFYFDYYDSHVIGGHERSVGARVHGFLLSRLYPKPDLVILLDAPPETVFARKGEGTIASLGRRRTQYLAHASPDRNFVVVDATGPLEEVTQAAIAAIRTFSE